MKLKFNGILVPLVTYGATNLAQEKTVTGIVSDNVGMPMPGVSVLIKGTQSGTQTDLEGNFPLKQPQIKFYLQLYRYENQRAKSNSIADESQTRIQRRTLEEV
jgi:hypothetical protein